MAVPAIFEQLGDNDMSDHDKYPEIMTSAQAMAFLQIGRTAFNKAVKSGAIPCWRINRKLIRFHRETLSTWVAGGAIPAAAAHAPLPLFDQQETPATPAAALRRSDYAARLAADNNYRGG